MSRAFFCYFLPIKIIIANSYISQRIAIHKSQVFVMKCALFLIPRMGSILSMIFSIAQDDVSSYSHLNNISCLTGYGLGRLWKVGS